MQEKQERVKNDIQFIISFFDKILDKDVLFKSLESYPIQKDTIKYLLIACRQHYDIKNMFFAAVSEGRKGIVKFMLKNKLINPDADDNHAICLASEKGHEGIISFLLKDERVSPEANEDRALYQAALNGHVNAVRCLLADKRVNPSANKSLALHAACQNKHFSVVRVFFSDKRMRWIDMKDHLSWATNNKYVDVVRFLLEESKTNSHSIDSAFDISIIIEHIELFELFLDDGRASVSPCQSNSYRCVLSEIAKRGNERMVKILLDDERIDPTVNHNYPIRIAAMSGHTGTVRLLLADGRADPLEEFEQGRTSVSWAVDNNHVAVVLLFLGDPRVRAIDVYHHAVKKNKVSIIQAMLKGNFVTPQACKSMGFRLAASEGDVETVKVLLANPEIKPQALCHEAIRKASANNHVEVVDVLLSDNRVKPQASNNEPIRIAVKNGHISVVRRLLQDERVNPCDNNNEAILSALINGDQVILKLLLADKRIILQSLLFLLEGITNINHKIQLLNTQREIIQDFLIIADSTSDGNLQQLPNIILAKFKDIVEIETSEKWYKDEGAEKIREQLNALRITLHQAILYLAEKCYYKEALHCWLALSPTDQQYKEAHFQAFQCAYFLGRDNKKTKFDAFFDALYCCLDNDGTFLDFEGKDQDVFDCYLLAATGMDIYPYQIRQLDLIDRQRYSLLNYIILLAARHDLSCNKPPAIEFLTTVNPAFTSHGFFFESANLELVIKLKECLPDSLISLNDLVSLKPVLDDIELWTLVKSEVNKMSIMRKNLKLLIRAIDVEINPSSKQLENSNPDNDFASTAQLKDN